MTKLQLVLNSIGGFFLSISTYFFGGFDQAFFILLIVIGIDYLTGVCKAILNRKLNSIVGLKGIIKKVGYFLIVALSVLLDKIMGNNSAIRTLVIYFFVANEGISILENWGHMGLPLPNKIYQVLEQLKEGEDNNGKT